jgi:hypothetical protein
VHKTLSTVALFLLAMLYKDEYCSWKEKFPSHLSSQNRIYFLLFKQNDPCIRKFSLDFINPVQKCESLDFLSTFPIVCLCEIFDS